MDERMSESAAEVIAAHRQAGPTKFSHRGGSSYVEYPRCGCGRQMHPREHAQHVLDALREAGWAVIAVPEVAHKGPHDTDAKFYRQVADRMENPKCRFDDLSGGNVRNAVRELLYRAAAAVSQDGEQ